jgi:ribose 5-phosphate isomerase B
MRVLIGADANGVDAAILVREILEEHGVEARDVSAEHAEADYPDVADRVASAVAAGEADRGVLICGTGIGMSIVANKVPGIRAALAHDTYSAERAIKSNNAQVLTMGALVIGPQLMRKVIETWLGAVWDETSPSARKVGRIATLEEDRWSRATGRTARPPR